MIVQGLRNRSLTISPAILLAVLLILVASSANAAQVIAVVGATVIDGNGGPPMAEATVVVVDKRISAVGPRALVEVPAGARIIDGTGKFVTPGFVDTNVHISLYGGGRKERKETSIKYRGRAAELTLESAQMHLKYGVTTVRDSYGALIPLMEVRDAIARGDEIGRAPSRAHGPWKRRARPRNAPPQRREADRGRLYHDPGYRQLRRLSARVRPAPEVHIAGAGGRNHHCD